ncbi:MAG: hypothetical protein IJM68_00525 [Synergistaceae bacterium]|nr:hypothetical protein [Synergistaceae bacterium]
MMVLALGISAWLAIFALLYAIKLMKKNITRNDELIHKCVGDIQLLYRDLEIVENSSVWHAKLIGRQKGRIDALEDSLGLYPPEKQSIIESDV